MLRVLLRLVADAALVAGVLFLTAGTFAWERAWLLVAVLLAVRMVGAVAVNRIHPELLRERAGSPFHREHRLLLFGVLATGFIGIPAVAGLDVFRWRLMPEPAPLVSGIGIGLFALGWSLKSLALRANAFAIASVRRQEDRGQVVADSGVYGVVRHPFYAADPLIFVGAGLWLQSYVAALVAVVPVVLMVLRLVLEERFLRRELPGYAAYADRVRYRLVPGVW
jgi:protein-S-isoprenylcysteine O-methyltransferase Ste14